jgi:hypothetical protein
VLSGAQIPRAIPMSQSPSSFSSIIYIIRKLNNKNKRKKMNN